MLASILFTCVHIPGLVAYFFWTLFRLECGLKIEAAEFGISDVAGCFFLVLPNLPLAYFITRKLLERYEGAVGHAMTQLIQNRGEISVR